MGRFQGYVGIANYMGARLSASEQALAPVLREAVKRGLIYLDDGASPRSLASQIAGANNLAFAKADIVIERCRRRPISTARWRGLRRRARARRWPSASAGALPVVDRAHRPMGEGGGKPRRAAGADQRSRHPGEFLLIGVPPQPASAVLTLCELFW